MRTLPKRPESKSKYRGEKGFSVLFVLSVGLVALMGVMAVTDALVTAQRNVASQVYMNESTSAAENALQYAVGLINTAAASGNLSAISSPIPIPPQLSGNANVSVTMVRVPTTPLYTANYTPIWNPNTYPALNNAQNPPYYLALSANAKVNSFQRTINVILGPSFNSTSPPLTPTNAYFNGALFGAQSVLINGVNVQFDPSYSPSTNSYAQQIVSSNNQIQITGSSTIYGSMNASSYNVPTMTLNQGVPSSTVMVEGNVSYTGSANPYSANFIVDPGTVTPTPGANVLGDGLASGASNQPGSVANNAALSQTAAAQVQNASGPAQFNSTGSPSSLNTIVQTPQTSQVADLGALSSTGTGSVTLNSGQYIASSVSTSPDSTLNVNALNDANGTPLPVQIFVQGNADSGLPLQLQGNINMTGATPSASNLQFFYNGTQSIIVTMGSQKPDFYGQIYAPNANVTVDTTGGAFHGSVVANNLTVTGSGSNPGVFYYDPRTVNPAGGGPGAVGPGFTPNGNGTVPTSFNVLSWQEQTTGAP